MAQAIAITLNTVVYGPRGTANGVTKWVKAGDTAFGGSNSELTESVRGPLEDGRNRIRVILTSPKLATEASQCACVGQSLGLFQLNATVDLPGSATPAERQDFRKRIKDYFASAEFTAAVDNLEGAWG